MSPCHRQWGNQPCDSRTGSVISPGVPQPGCRRGRGEGGSSFSGPVRLPWMDLPQPGRISVPLVREDSGEALPPTGLSVFKDFRAQSETHSSFQSINQQPGLQLGKEWWGGVPGEEAGLVPGQLSQDPLAPTSTASKFLFPPAHHSI